MTNRLTDLSVGSLKVSTTRRPKKEEQIISVVTPVAPVVEPEIVTDLKRLLEIPGLTPYLVADLIPDLYYLQQLEGLTAFLNELYPGQESSGPDLITPPGPVDPQLVNNIKRKQELHKSFKLNGIKIVSSELNVPLPKILERGAQRLTVLAGKADPTNPASIIFNHESQDIHRSTQKVEIDLLTNEPEIIERTTIQCKCGSGKVKTVAVQTRRADEPPTIFATCVVCKQKWKMSAA